MNKRRLLKLADLLEADAKNKKGMRFDLRHVGIVDDPGVIEANCGTTGCAMGLAAVSGAFKRAGLSYRVVGTFIDTKLNGRAVDYAKAASRIFGISMKDANFLFCPFEYPQDKLTGAVGERFVAKRIRKLVADGGR